jgi:hypothetical protein
VTRERNGLDDDLVGGGGLLGGDRAIDALLAREVRGNAVLTISNPASTPGKS